MLQVNLSYFDVIVLTKNIGGAEVQTLLVDDGSSCHIFFLEAFSNMGTDMKNLKPCSRGLVRFTEHETPFMWMISLPLTMRNGPRQLRRW